MAPPTPPNGTRAPDSPLASGAKTGLLGSLAFVLGRLVAEQWIVPGANALFSAANPATLAELTGALPFACGGLALGAVSGFGTHLRDLGAYAGARWARWVGRFAP